MSAPLLVVAHEGYRNGATRVLLDLLGELRAAVGRPLRVRLQREGPLSAELRAHDDRTDPLEPPGAVLVNSALAVGALATVDLRTPAVVYVHEVGEALAALAPDHRRLLAERAHRVLCVSERGRRDLEALGVPPERLVLVPPTVPRRTVSAGAAADARRQAGAGDGHRLVVGCGEASWRKGTDLFVALAGALRHEPDVHLAWIGRRHRSVARHLDADVARWGLADRLTWVGEVDDALPLLAGADLLVVTSREDPQPLVPLEAATVGTATVALAGTGVDDFERQGAAVCVPYPDVAGLAGAAVALLADPTGGAALVDAGDRLVGERSPAAAAAAIAAAFAPIPGGPDGAPDRTRPDPEDR